MTVHYVRMGAGEPLLLLHGIGHRWQAWQPVLPELSAHHETIAIDLPGFGESPVPEAGMPGTMAESVARLGEFLSTIGVERPHVAGYSLGGAMALELAAAGIARSATAFSPAGFFTAAERRRAVLILRAMRAGTFLPAAMIRRTMRTPRLRALSLGPIVANPLALDAERAVGDAFAMRRGRGFGPTARATRRYRFEGVPAVPVTVGWGSKDWILRPVQAERARSRLPDATHVILPGCGHVPMSDNADLVTKLILDTTGSA
jgi:pimeloyl-ACP methyl ester carboxylesterase